ncbi:hypothetical protein A2311_06310 [candidate division WOR-1 bacterium RIFOXYB2_FULL_48_7]|uniref:Uncharacterized protein n=1 Tax=candidate division WOR-1 bacterium RIFOXYB2_FULL_48_7 TaxID=1802583 RepID=A0A1F4TVI9_UNCSA|nr:MAG: hypothetical protein A2311_06310 [candidate division WOR-1 bacterium RIFOXYB2_FULL_48_7]
MLAEAFVGKKNKLQPLVFLSPVFYPNKLGLQGEKTAVGNVVAHGPGITFIKTYPGSSWLKDTLLALAGSKIKKIVFLGTCGAINPDYLIGEVVTPDENAFDLPRISCFSFDSLLDETKSRLKQLWRQKYDVVDLELTAFLQAAKAAGIVSQVLLLIQDQPLTKPFYRPLKAADKQALDMGIQRLFQLCRQICQTSRVNTLTRLKTR